MKKQVSAVTINLSQAKFKTYIIHFLEISL